MVPREREQGGGHALPRFRPRRRSTDRLDHEKLLTVCSTELQDHPFAASPYFADWRLAAAAAQNAALADSTRAKRDSSWRCYERFLGRIDGLGREPFLQGLGREAKAETFACFAAALRDGRLRSRQPQEAGNGPLSGSIRATLDSVAQTFRLNKFESPIHDAAGRLDPLLALQLKRYADEDPGPTPQQALPLEVIRKVRSWARNETDIAIGQLVVVAFFFAMRSCEYSDVGSRRTTSVIRVDDVRFRQKGQDLQTTDRGQLENADTVTITFRRQKNGDKGATVTQHRNDRQGQADICPVRALADLTTRVRGYDCLSRTNPKINAVRKQDSDEPQYISSKAILRQLRMATTLAGEKRLGLQASSIGTHSIRSGAAMAMHLAGVPSETIQMVGRWRSQTFMRYLRIQVPDSTLGVAARMTSRQSFYTIAPDSADERQPENGGNQVDSQSRDGPPLDNYHGTDTARRTRRERQNY